MERDVEMTNIVAHCPFCGGTVEDGTLERTHGGRNVMHNERDDCHSFRGMLIRIEAWNRRAPVAPSDQG